ncbi:uncharacterized protein SCHCODRAFT_02502367 [Schizophyllum commune H4-8]|nr:uncharacterized protein SCHCODRAFT_02502367 [Schizophyllum commune H4-8]KAI5892352.1 hypothetical protein SCHCODRAFT_02502367 [Schizophyllum commune H4-8]
MASCALPFEGVGRFIPLPFLHKPQLEANFVGDWPLIPVLDIPDTCDAWLLFLVRSTILKNFSYPRCLPSPASDRCTVPSTTTRSANYHQLLVDTGRVSIDGVRDFTFLIGLADPDASLTFDTVDDFPRSIPVAKEIEFLLTVRIPRIHTLHILVSSKHDPSTFIHALATISGTNADVMLCPALADLNISGHTPEDLLNVWTVISRRAHAGVPLKEIHLHQDISRYDDRLRFHVTKRRKQSISLSSVGTPIDILTTYIAPWPKEASLSLNSQDKYR